MSAAVDDLAACLVKQCSHCKQTKSVDLFGFRTHHTRRSICRECDARRSEARRRAKGGPGRRQPEVDYERMPDGSLRRVERRAG